MIAAELRRTPSRRPRLASRSSLAPQLSEGWPYNGPTAVSFDEDIRSALDRALAGVRDHLDADVRAFAQELVRAAADERARAVKDAAEAAAADVRRQAQAQLSQFRDIAQRHADELRRTAESQINQLKRAVEETRRTADEQIDAARRNAQAQIENAQAQIDAVRQNAQAEVEAGRQSAQAQIQAGRQSSQAEIDTIRLGARTEIDEVRRAADAQIAELRSAADRRVAELTQDIANARSTAAAEAEELVVAQLAAAAGENDRKMAEALERARTDHHQAVLAQSARLADAIRSLDEGRSLGDVLDTLAECAGHEVDRAAVLVVRADRVKGWRLSGFSASAPPARTIDLSFEDAGLPGAVVRTGVAVSRPAVEPGPSAERQPALPPFAQDAGPRHALALPITVGGAVVAVLYADAPRLDTPSASSRWPAIVDALARHASRVLEAMTVQQAAGLSLPRPVARGSHASLPGPLEQAGNEADEDAARRYARLLLSEIRMYNEPLIDEGRRSRDLLSRLSGEIARARRLYEARIPSSVLARSDYFDQELVRTLADGDRSLLGSVQ